MLLASLLVAGLASAWPALPKWYISTDRLIIQAGNLAADFTIVNDDRIRERFEILAYSWSQQYGIDMRRADVDDVLVFPRLFELAPGMRQRIRIGVLNADPLIESDYRIVVEQLFDPQRDRPGIHFLLAYDLPLFVEPEHPLVDAQISGVSGYGDDLAITVRNGGNVHAFARAVTVQWQGVERRYGQPFYVLPHSTITFRLRIRRCGRGFAVVAPDFDSHLLSVTAPLSIPCR